MFGTSRRLLFQHSDYTVPPRGRSLISRREEYHPNWLTINELEWFKERITTNGPGTENPDNSGRIRSDNQRGCFSIGRPVHTKLIRSWFN